MFVKSKHYKKHKGFTLVELSMVIVIIGLIVAGVVGGQSLLKQSKLRSIATDFNKFMTAHNAFKLEYDAIPVDFNKATAYWGGVVSNGDGNGALAPMNPPEDIYYWRHLQYASLIEGVYTGALEGGLRNVIGVNIPKSDFSSDAGFQAFGYPLYNVTGLRNIQITIASKSQSCNAWLNGILFSAKEAYSLDAKFDDGVPSSGNYYTAKGVTSGACVEHPDCVMDGSVATSTTYNFTNNNISCRIFYWIKK
jgi:prepilin-type N-terminal cleavage/methylation domain-containing protein